MAKKTAKTEEAKKDDKVIRLVACPTCKKSLEYSTANPHRPFCSERCRIRDAAAWATDGYAIAGEPVNKDDHLESGDVDEDSSS